MKQQESPNITKILKEYNADIKRHMSVLSEDFQSKIQIIVEQYGDIKNTLDSHTKILESHTEILESHTEMIASIKEDVEVMKIDLADTKKDVEVMKGDIASTKADVEIIKTDIGFIKGDLKKKVDHDEFLTLERRMKLTESKMRMAHG